MQKAYTFFKQALDLANKNLPVLDATALNTNISFLKFLKNFIKNEEELQRLIKNIKEKQEVKDFFDGNISPEQEINGYMEELKSFLFE